MGINVKGSGGSIRFFGGGGSLRVVDGGGGGGGPGSPESPIVLPVDATRVGVEVDSGVRGAWREGERGESPYYARYGTFVCPGIPPGGSLRIRWGVAVDGGPEVDTYASLFAGSSFSLPGAVELASDDDSGSGSYTVWPNTEILVSSPTVVPGDPYVLELTTFSTGVTGSLSVAIDVV